MLVYSFYGIERAFSVGLAYLFTNLATITPVVRVGHPVSMTTVVCWWCVRLVRLTSAVPLLVTLMTVVCCVLVVC